MKQVREGWVVFDRDGEPVSIYPKESSRIAWRHTRVLLSDYKIAPKDGYTCRRVRVTIETIEQGESDG